MYNFIFGVKVKAARIRRSDLYISRRHRENMSICANCTYIVGNGFHIQSYHLI